MGISEWQLKNYQHNPTDKYSNFHDFLATSVEYLYKEYLDENCFPVYQFPRGKT